MKKLLLASGVIESGAGLAVLCRPSSAVALLLGSPLVAPAAVTLGSVTGVALFALGVACWLAHYDGQSCAARGLVTAMVLGREFSILPSNRPPKKRGSPLGSSPC